MATNVPIAEADSPLLELQGIGKRFRSESGTTVAALGSIDLAIHRGQFVTLLGATGCGKTTLLNIIAGITEPDQGRLYASDDVRIGRNVAYVFQHYTLFPWRTALANVAFGLQMRGIPRRQRRDVAAGLLAKVGLAGFEHARPHELSGGMRQRAAIAQALAIEPALLLMDEPFGAVDDATRAELQQMLIDLWQDRRMTILFVTHNLDEAILLGSRIVVFGARPGRVVRQLDVDLPRPRERNTRQFTELFLEIRRALSTGLD